ncbi:toll/interleukin-1 receptor domain-containing protein [Streptomyces sp. ID05-26A]|nr:toll/interleukin-1 receptor domain-containing protein [Streptomyces sp. ID05-26A]
MAAVFVCHKLVDKVEVEKLVREIEQRGHRVWYSSSEIKIGDSIVGKINEGLAGADYVVACFSEADCSSSWMAAEWMSTLARQVEGDSVKLLTALFAGGKPPAILADKRYADLSQDWVAGVELLCAALR